MEEDTAQTIFRNALEHGIDTEKDFRLTLQVLWTSTERCPDDLCTLVEIPVGSTYGTVASTLGKQWLTKTPGSVMERFCCQANVW